MKVRDLYYASMSTPLGSLWAAGTSVALTDISLGVSRRSFLETLASRHARAVPVEDRRPFGRLFGLLGEYFKGRPVVFDLVLAPEGSPFDLMVWKALREVAWGETASYGLVAGRIGTAARAVGGACSRNPIPIVIPCHRITGSSSLGGYSGGTALKRALLDIEGNRL